MSIFKKQNPILNANDSSLVMYSLGGNRDAFCLIVARYQNLLCSIAYSAVGDIKHSEDIAQESFVEAWKKLDTLHDPEKLKSWLCGILRFKVSRYRRKEANQPTIGADELAQHHLPEAEETELEYAAIQQQQQSLLWKVLEQIDDIYREPLILFYREQQSVERVAAELDLTLETVKQRLSRGRKLLKSAMSTFVEDGLKSSKPGAAFTAIVMTTISSISPPAKAALLSAGVAKTGSIFKLTTILVLLASFAGLISSYFGVKAGLAQSRTKRERHQVIKVVSLYFMIAIIYILGMLALKHLAINASGSVLGYAIAAHILVFGLVSAYLILTHRMLKEAQKLRAQERIFHPEAFLDEAHHAGAKQREYKSKLCLFGVPLCHFQFGMPEADDNPAYGWIAGGSKAYGLLFAWGGVAIAPVSVGIVSLGIISVGAIGVGVFGLGTVGIGIIGFGSAAIAYKAYGAFSALGWESALSNGFSTAVEGAIGHIGYASQVNNEQAADLTNLAMVGQTTPWVLGLIAVLVIIPAIWHSRKVRQRMR
ncbi:RNA polymerase sigma factor [Paraglaciecola sp. L3A3]|uniref:RNA polymerase sigma factor n=1 Tax=Paraglaciecola sp. L3A3 TaxID=2686358 RepID=UPI00131E1BF3|nr:sigma-70 family RNA polymerase sigma factor [Paraglaciecola sp. L3A3]